MLKRIMLLLMWIWLAVFSAPASAEFWNTDAVQFPLKEKLYFNIIPEFRFRGDANDLYYLMVYIGPTFSLSKTFDLNIFYAPKNQKRGPDWMGSSNVFIDFIYKGGSFSNRFRFENDFTQGAFKLRDRLEFKKDGWYVYDELFFNINRSVIDENRAAAGYALKYGSDFSISIGYLVRSQRSASGGDWSNTNVLLLNTSTKI